MPSGMSNSSLWSPRFMSLRSLPADGYSPLFTQKPEQPVSGDHGSPEYSRYPAAGMDRGPDPPQPGPAAVRVPGAVQRPAHPEGAHRPVESPARAPPGPEVPGMQHRVFREVRRRGLGEPYLLRHARDLTRDEGIVDAVLPSVGRGGEPQRQHVAFVGIGLARAIIVNEGHGLLGLMPGFEALVEGARVRGQHDAVRREACGQLLL